MNPYEKTAEEMKRQSEGPKRLAKNAVNAGATAASIAGAATFAPLLARAAPFLSEYIPENLAIKGLSKVSPKLGKFVEDSLNSGYDFKEVKDFIGEQVKESQQPAKQAKNIIEQESPELHQFLDQEIRKGRKPIEAAALAQNDKRFSELIGKLSKKHKTPWSSIIESVFGNGDMGLQQNKQQEQQKPMQQQEGQGGPGQQTIMQALQAATEARKRRKQPNDSNLPVYYDYK